MGTISSGTGEEVTQDSIAQGTQTQVASVSGVDSAKSAARDFLDAVKEIQVELEAQVIQLQSQIAGYELAVSALSNQVNSLKEELANQPDCDEDDGYAKSETPEQMAGEAVPPQMNENGGPS